MLTAIARAPTRIDLAGGTLDLWPVHHVLKKKATVNVAVRIEANVDVRLSNEDYFELISDDQQKTVRGSYDEVVRKGELPLLELLLEALWDPGLSCLSIKTKAHSPAGAGLGGSSCLAVTVGGALDMLRSRLSGAPRLSEQHLVQTVSDVEARLIHAPTGCQDYWGALRGGINVLNFPYGGTQVETLAPSLLAGLNDTMVLCYSGKSRASALNNWEIFKGVFDRNTKLIERLEVMGELACRCADAARKGSLDDVLELSHQEWRERVKVWPTIETPETKGLDLAATSAGAWFSRVCGAGGGGVMAVFTPPEHRSHVCRALIEAGGQVLDGPVSDTGLRMECYDDE